MAGGPGPDDIKKSFIHFYGTSLAESNHGALADAYQEHAMLSFQGDNVSGKSSIAAFWADKTTRFQELFSIFPGESEGSLTIRNHMYRASEGSRAINDGSEGTASGFVRSYYEAFDSGSGEARGRALAGIYRGDSFLLFEGDDVYSGAEPIIGKLSSLPATAHNLETLDVQPIADSAMLVLVTGHIRIEGQENALPFNQSFQIVGGGSDFYLSNDIFAFNYS